MKKEIGSNFWLSPSDLIAKKGEYISPLVFGCEGLDYIWLSSGRKAIQVAIEETIHSKGDVKHKVVLLPEFTCESVIEPFEKSNLDVIYYPIDGNLNINLEKLKVLIEEYNPILILFHNYFGFDTTKNINSEIHLLKQRGIVIIEDLTQRLYSSFPLLNADFFIGSIRKWCGVPDGGFVVNVNDRFSSRPIEYDKVLEALKVEASILKYDYIINNKGNKEEFLLKFKEAEEKLDNQDNILSISPLSLNIQSELDINQLKEIRRNNYKVLLKELKNIYDIQPVFEELKEDEVPLYFPIKCKNRNALQKILASHNIFAPIVWPKPQCISDVSQEAASLYENLLCLPIDQRYDEEDMMRMMNVIKDNSIWTGWLTWDQIKPFRDLISRWELEVMTKFHYPDKEFPLSFTQEKVDNLESYLKGGNTFFWGAFKDGVLVGYYWAYVTDFLFERTWMERSSYLCEEVRGLGLGMYSKRLALEKAKELNCTVSKSMYAPFNKAQAHIYKTLGFYESRIEVTKNI